MGFHYSSEGENMNTEVAKGMIRQYEKDGDERWLEQAVAQLGFEHDAPVIPEPDFDKFYNWLEQDHDRLSDQGWNLRKTEWGFVFAFDMIMHIEDVINELHRCGFVVASLQAEDKIRAPMRDFYIEVKPARCVL